MAIVPTKVQDFLDFADQHSLLWNTVYAQIGISNSQAGDYKSNAQDARANYNAALDADAAKKAAFHLSQTSIAALRQQTADLLTLIKGHAENAANPNTVYDAAQIPAPQPGQPAPPPGTPTDIKVELVPEGWVVLNWKCPNPEGTTGTIYEVRRKTGSGNFEFIGAVGARKFVDNTLVAGSSNVTYQITAIRATLRGTSAQFNVNFGVGGGGFNVSSVKLAA